MVITSFFSGCIRSRNKRKKKGKRRSITINEGDAENKKGIIKRKAEKQQHSEYFWGGKG